MAQVFDMRKIAKNIIIAVKLLRESFVFAFSSIAANKLRTFLSLLGITIGIFSIVTVFTAVDALTSSIEKSLSSLGGNVIYIDQFPWTETEGQEYEWWKYRQRPRISYTEYEFLQKNSKHAEYLSFLNGLRRTLKYKSNETSAIQVLAVTHSWENIGAFEVEQGRYFTQQESTSGFNVVILGYTVATELFGNENPIGKYMKIGDFKARVVGVTKRQGKSLFSPIDYDNVALIPYKYAATMVNMALRGGEIAVMAKSNIPNSEIVGELRMLMRSSRRLAPTQDDNFALNELSSLKSQTDQIYAMLNIVGIVIGGFSILIGAFGVANIMFVSVKERTNIIGIQKALGAKNVFILTQFLYESVLLSVIGGILGLLLVFGIVAIATSLTDYELALSFKNIVIGLSISAAVGLLAGFIPAYMASRLNPVVAINSK